MNRKISILVLIVGICCSTVFAEEQEKKQGSAISEWIKGLQQKIAQIVPKKTVVLTNSVAGVRGAKEDSQTKLYWKGKKGDEAVTEEELTEFKTAIETASGGDRASAAKEIQQFMAKFPDSALIPDAKKTLDLVKAEPKPEEKAEKKPEDKKP